MPCSPERPAATSLVAVLTAMTLAAQPALAQSAAELRELIELQRRQLEEQARQLERMEERLRALEAESEVVREQASEAERVATETASRLPPRPAIGAGGTGIALTLSGQINRMLLAADDGDDTELYHVDNVNSSSRLRVVGSAAPADGVTVGTTFEVEMRSNASTEVNQNRQDTGIVAFRDRIVEVFAEHADWGRLSIGQGSTASDGAAKVDLSGTTVIATAQVSDTAGGLLFFDQDADALTTITIGSVFNIFDGLSRQDRLRYDSPRIAGFTLAGDLISDSRWSTALRWAGRNQTVSAAAAIAYSDPGDDRDWLVNGSASVLHEPTGLSVTLAGGGRDNPGRKDARSLYGKLGWQRDLFAFGRTAFSIDYGRYDEGAVRGDEAVTFGLFAVQNIRSIGMELFGGYRFHELDRREVDVDDIHVFVLGTRVRF